MSLENKLNNFLRVYGNSNLKEYNYDCIRAENPRSLVVGMNATNYFQIILDNYHKNNYISQ